MDSRSHRHSSRYAQGPVFLAPAQPPPREKTPLFQFRVHCSGGLKFDVQAATEADALKHVRRRHSARIIKTELIGEVRSHVA